MHPFTLTEEQVKHVSGGESDSDIWSCELPIDPLDGPVYTLTVGETGGPSEDSFPQTI